MKAIKTTDYRLPTTDLSLYVITTSIPALKGSHLEMAKAAIAGGATIIQFRESQEKETKKIFEEALKIRKICKQAKIPLIIDDRLDITLAAQADGVHLGEEDLPVKVSRKILGKNKLIGASVGSLKEALQAEEEGADYLGVGPIYATQSKSDAGEPTGTKVLAQIKEAVDIPVVAIGGIAFNNIDEVLRAGADGIAVISAITKAPNMKEATQSLLKKIRKSKLMKNLK